MSKEPVIYQEDIVVTIGGLDTTAAIEINQQTFAATILFWYARRTYGFNITKWSGTGLPKLVELFYAADEARDPEVFGVPFADNTSGAAFVPSEQCVRVMVKACKDILVLLDCILVARGKDVFSYAVWYRENHREEDTYKQYISKITCKCIVRTNFLVCDAVYDVVN
jgi:hypothetical protein